MVNRNTYRFRKGDVIEVEEYPHGRYGAPGRKRKEKRKLTPEQVRVNNAQNKSKRCRHRLYEYFHPGDMWVTWTYDPKNRPASMQAALQDFQKAMRYVKREYKKRRYETFWIRNIEQGTKGAWHIHLIINCIEDTANILHKAWNKGSIYLVRVKDHKYYEPDFVKLANYITKDEYSTYPKKDGTPGKSRIRQASYNTSRNMPLPEPKKDKLVHWKTEPKPKKGYYLARMYEGITPWGMTYRRYTMIRLNPSLDLTHRRI